MHPVIQALFDRRSVRAYTGKAIPEADVRTILEAAAQAPSPGNQQLYTILRVTSPEKKRRLSESCDHQPFIEKAELVLVFCADCRKWYHAYLEAGCIPRKPDVGDLMLAVCDANIAAQNAVTAAEALGIGSCYIGDILENIETQREILSLPEYVFPAAMVVFGYPTEQQKRREKPKRFDLKYIVHEDAYHDLTPTELREMFRERVGDRTFEDWMRAFCSRKYNSDFSGEMSRSVRNALELFLNGEDRIAYCGVNCLACADYKSGVCPSCRATEWKDDDICMPVRCCREKGITSCAFCGTFPCADMEAFFEESDSHKAAYRRLLLMRERK